MSYTDADRKRDFDFFVKNNSNLYTEYRHKFIAIKNEKVIGTADDVEMLIACLAQKYEIGTYIIQECNGNESSYTSKLMRLIISGSHITKPCTQSHLLRGCMKQ